jgi:hypothetical protein
MVGLGVAGVLQGVATVCAAFAVGALVTAVVHGDDLVGPITFLALAFGARAALAYAVEGTAATAGVAVSGALLTIHLAIRGGSKLVTLGWHEARDRLAMGRLPGRR